MTEDEGRLVSRVVLDLVACAQERIPDARLHSIHVAIIVESDDEVRLFAETELT